MSEEQTITIHWRIWRFAWITAPPMTIILPYTYLFWDLYWEVR